MPGFREIQMRLISNINELAEQNHNPIQLLLQQLNITAFNLDTKYPETNLVFGNGNWRTFFHVHGKNRLFPDEYGHFHIFTKEVDTHSWVHVIALSMDAYGQPAHWFCTNHWVTAGEWFAAEKMKEILGNNLDMVQASGLLGDWLFNMLGFYRDQITDLLFQRDEVIKKGDPATLLMDRKLYMLSWKDIDLLADLKRRMK